MKKFDENFLKYWGLSGAKACKSCRSLQELSNEYFLAKSGVDTEEHGPYKVCSFDWKIRERFDVEPFSTKAQPSPRSRRVFLLAVSGAIWKHRTCNAELRKRWPTRAVACISPGQPGRISQPLGKRRAQTLRHLCHQWSAAGGSSSELPKPFRILKHFPE